MSTAVRVTTVGAVVVVALVAAIVSYSHMQTVAQEAGERWRSWLVPLSVDGLVVAGSMVPLTRRRAGLPGGWLAWYALLGGVGASPRRLGHTRGPALGGRLRHRLRHLALGGMPPMQGQTTVQPVVQPVREVLARLHRCGGRGRRLRLGRRLWATARQDKR